MLIKGNDKNDKNWNIVHLWSRPDAVLLLFFFSSFLKNDPEAGCDDPLKRTRSIFQMISPELEKNVILLTKWLEFLLFNHLLATWSF